MTDRIDQSNDVLNDEELLDREADQRGEFFRLGQFEPQLRDTTYYVVDASRSLLHAWDRWMETNVAVRLRGLLPHDATVRHWP